MSTDPIAIASVSEMHALAARTASACRAGDLIVLDGDLGAGKTAFVQGFGRALGVTEVITSPTFVIARSYRSAQPPLVHVDAYRLGSSLELDDLDLDADIDESVTVVEWGAGKVEQLTADRLVIRITRSGDPMDETRLVTLEGVGERWTDALVSAIAGTP